MNWETRFCEKCPMISFALFYVIFPGILFVIFYFLIIRYEKNTILLIKYLNRFLVKSILEAKLNPKKSLIWSYYRIFTVQCQYLSILNIINNMKIKNISINYIVDFLGGFLLIIDAINCFSSSFFYL